MIFITTCVKIENGCTHLAVGKTEKILFGRKLKMNSFKVKAFKKTSTSFEYWIEDPDGKLHHDKFKIIQGVSCEECLESAISRITVSYLNSLSDELAASRDNICSILGNLNSFISRDFQIPKNLKGI